MSRQADLFGDADLPQAQAATAVVRIDAPAAALSKAQREFNRLSERIVKLREELARWQAAEERARKREAAEVAPLHAKLTARQREAVLWIDAFLARPPKSGERLPKKLRTKLKFMLLLLARAVLSAAPDDEVEAAHDRHADQSHREDQRAQADCAAAMLGEVMGDDSLFEGPADSIDELMARAAERMQSQAGAAEDEPERAAASSRPSRAEKARARDAQALKEASQSVREVYRRLASSLHPDREPDAAERVRKTALMARVNDAYGRNDLLELLSVQMAIEQIDDEHLRGVSDERLRHYTRVLKEQEQTLQAEIEAARMPLMEHLSSLPQMRGLPGPEGVDRAIDVRLKDVRDALRYLEADFAQLRDARTRVAFLTVLEVEDPDEEIDPFEAMLLEAALSEVMAPPSRRPGGRGRGRR